MEKRSIVLVDDHVVVRNGLKELIEKLGPYVVSGQFDNGTALLASLPLEPSPDLLILDLNMPGMTTVAILEALRTSGQDTPVLILTLDSDEPTIIRLFRSGVRGFLKKDCNAATLGAALRSIFETGYYANEFLALSLKRDTAEPGMTEQQKVLEQLTAREKEFLKLVCHEKEYTYEQIADQMNVQHRTVDGYREAIFEKFGIKSKTGLVLFVLKHQLFEHLQIDSV
jgi:two-component system, NarL family, invasion response regulator UvrY